MKVVLIAAVLMACAGTVQATPFDIGPNGTSYSRSFSFGQFNGTQMEGQTLSFDINFNNNVHLFRHTDSAFSVSLAFQTNGTDNTGFILGRGCLLDALGDQMCGLRTLGSARSDAAVWVGLYPLFDDVTGIALDIARPLDFYGVHIELTLPDTGLIITDGGLSFLAQDFRQNGNRSNPFRIGPARNVPDSGSTMLLLCLGILPLVLGKFDRTVKHAI